MNSKLAETQVSAAWLRVYFTMDLGIVYCNELSNAIDTLEIIPSQW